MSYVKKTWVNGDVITADGLNNMEEGISEAKKAAAQNTTAVTTAQETADAAKTAADSAAADASKAAAAAEANIAGHNTSTEAHADLRQELQAISERINAALDSDDTTLDELSEIVAYIKSNKTLIDAITTSKVSVSDIVDNLTTNVSNKPLSAAQGVVLKALVETTASSLQTLIDGKLGSTATAAAATKLATARTIQTDLSSTDAASFNGTANVTPGVKGVLGVPYGGSGATTAAKALQNFGLTATAAELNFMDGVTSNVQTQLDDKLGKTANAASATKLATARTIQTDLSSTDAVSFNGTANVSPGVKGVLGIPYGGTGGTTGDAACAGIGAVKKSGDTMTGKLYAANGSGVYGADRSWASMTFYDNSDTPKVRGSMMVSDVNRFHINQQETGASYAERYMLPEIGSGLTADVWYNILTSKKPVTIAQGGHGATNKKNARKNLGAEIQVGTASVGTSGTTITFTDAFSGVPVVTANGSKQTSIRVTDVTATGCTLTSGESGNTVQWQAMYISN